MDARQAAEELNAEFFLDLPPGDVAMLEHALNRFAADANERADLAEVQRDALVEKFCPIGMALVEISHLDFLKNGRDEALVKVERLKAEVEKANVRRDVAQAKAKGLRNDG